MIWQDKVCVITGASSGIGRALAVDLAARKAKVCAAARRADRLVELIEAIGGEGAGHSYVVTDVAKRPDAVALARHVGDTYGRCDVLVNNAGLSREGLFDGAAVADIEFVMKINFFGAVYCTAELLPLLKASAPASVVNVGSVAGRLASGAVSGYCASKFALVGWSESVRLDLAPSGIAVGLVEPGPIPTEGFPQTGLAADPLLRWMLVTDAAAARAIRRTIARRAPERTVPRPWYLARVARVLAPPLYRAAQAQVTEQMALRSPAGPLT